MAHLTIAHLGPPAREQQLATKLEQERLKWEKEKQDLLEQLRQKTSPYKGPRRYAACFEVLHCCLSG